MELLFKHECSKQPAVSIILLDWSVRDSYHILDYLAHQTVDRDQYEVIWIEFYSKRAKEIEQGLKKCSYFNLYPIVDTWIVLDMPQTIYYHKHLMYNVGIVASSGRIIAVCDSDAIVKPTFVESIIKAFEEDENIVLHMDEVRNNSHRYYPFCYPSIDEIIGEGCINWVEGKPRGVVDLSDPLHLRNYGACMCALRKDLIAIGGADEHLDYLGHICGPYEMTFRLINAGKKEIWHETEWLYHVWHPGQAGENNYLGPHDGRHMSSTALDVLTNDRWLPLVENPALKRLRREEKRQVSPDSLLSHVISEESLKKWVIEKKKPVQLEEKVAPPQSFGPSIIARHPIVSLRLINVLIKMLLRQTYHKATTYHFNVKSVMSYKGPVYLIYKIFIFLKRMAKYNLEIMEKCRNCLHELSLHGIKEIALLGANDVAKIMIVLTSIRPVKIVAIYEELNKREFSRFNLLPVEGLKGYKGSVVITSLVGTEDKIKRLKNMGIKGDKIFALSFSSGSS